MFTEVMPLLQKRRLLLSISLADGERIRVTLIPQKVGDPDPKLSIEEVRSFYANQFPELTTAAISGPETVGDRLRYRFERAIGAKG